MQPARVRWRALGGICVPYSSCAVPRASFIKCALSLLSVQQDVLCVLDELFHRGSGWEGGLGAESTAAERAGRVGESQRVDRRPTLGERNGKRARERISGSGCVHDLDFESFHVLD